MNLTNIDTRNLTSFALDWAVAKALGCELTTYHENYKAIANRAGQDAAVTVAKLTRITDGHCVIGANGCTHSIPGYSRYWAEGGPIIERERISIVEPKVDGYGWTAAVGDRMAAFYNHTPAAEGPTPLVAAMRCFVALRLGPVVAVPSDLITTTA